MKILMSTWRLVSSHLLYLKCSFSNCDLPWVSVFRSSGSCNNLAPTLVRLWYQNYCVKIKFVLYVNYYAWYACRLTRCVGSSLMAVGLFSVSKLTWTWSVSAEVFGLNNCFVGLLMVLAVDFDLSAAEPSSLFKARCINTWYPCNCT